MIPQCNPKANYSKYKKEIDDAISKSLNSGRYILGDEVRAFENEFAQFNQSKGCVGVANGTDALILSLMALGLKESDKVLTVSHTAVATVNAICRAGLVPCFVDVDKNSYTMDYGLLEQILIEDTQCQIKAVIVVHIYGNICSIDKIAKICKSKGVDLIEDCAQAHGAEYNGIKVGNFGILGTFSFYPTKNLGAIGDGGAVVANDHELITKLKILREYGWKERYVSYSKGINSRLDEIQAAILRVKLKHLEADTNNRIKIANRYLEGIKNSKIYEPQSTRQVKHVYHQYVIRCSSRNELQANMLQNGIGTSIHYPVPVHLQPAYSKYLIEPFNLMVTENLSKTVLSLPMFPEMTMDEITFVIKTINAF